jgi:PII-like signaling protein
MFSAPSVQTVKPSALMIYDDNTDEDRIDIRENETYRYLLEMLDRAGIKWSVVFGSKLGQHHGHQLANKGEFKYVWRLDDDEIAEPQVLEKYLNLMKDGVGAVGGTVLTKGVSGQGGSSKIERIYNSPNVQWSEGSQVIDADHLHSTFLYRAGIVNYDLSLSPVAHREETLFTHELKRAGYTILIDQTAATHHLRQSSTGIRSHNSEWFYSMMSQFSLERWRNGDTSC